MTTNEVERQRWNDERWAALWPKRERLTDAVSAFVLDAAALAPGERVLDVGCGGGKTALAAGLAVGAAGSGRRRRHLGAADRAGDPAGQRRPAPRTSRSASLDMQTDTVEGGPFDVALSQFGVMFFDEPITAFANIRAHLRPGGRLAFACWQAGERNPWFFAPAIAEFLPPPPAPAPGKAPTGPFALADPRANLRASCARRASSTSAAPLTSSRSRRRRTPSWTRPSSRSWACPPEQLERAQAAVAEHMEQFALSPTLSRFPLAFQVFAATNPG